MTDTINDAIVSCMLNPEQPINVLLFLAVMAFMIHIAKNSNPNTPKIDLYFKAKVRP